ncbi:general transcription factor IIF subunit 1 isoform X2 [Manduca sexta]|uniref:general transcription factor IIF subunit 1 isoform X2 n=1 Tax=Manduca sexta TaxID=7130 RepID=UPI001182631B|nr:general transcription factor IIF subunit 1 isoform X2 [Manduca sexta]
MTTPGSSSSANVQEFSIRVPKNVRKKYHVMRFNATLNVDFAKWTHVKMERENNIKEFKGADEEMPKFGAGSEYGREIREEARRKKFGIVARKYKPEDQPWILKVGGKTGKKFKGIREGGVSENAAYYVFTHAADGAIDAYPLQEWYNFQPIQRYKALSAEEAEQEFGRRNKVINYFSLMFRKRMRGEDGADDGEDPDEKKTKGKAKKDLKISEMDEWADSDDDSMDSENGEKDNDSDSGVKKKKKKAPPKKKRKVEDEAFEESDDGDEEGREKDYISDSSDSDSDHEAKANKELKGVAEEDALRKLLTSDEDSEEEQEQKQESEQEDEPTKEGEERASKLTKKKKKTDENKKDSSSELSSDSDTDPESGGTKKPKKSKNANSSEKNAPVPSTSGASLPGSAATSRAGSPAPPVSAAAAAVAAANAAANAPPAKRHKLDPSYTECGVTEEAVRRYLARKPMTTTELLTKFKSKRTGVSSERLVETMTQILKRINPLKQNINGKMYLSIK